MVVKIENQSGEIDRSVYFGETLRRVRKNAGLVLDDVADAIGISRSYLSSIETGRRTPLSHEQIEELASSLNLEPGARIELLHAAAITTGCVPITKDTTEETVFFALRVLDEGPDELTLLRLLACLNDKANRVVPKRGSIFFFDPVWRVLDYLAIQGAPVEMEQLGRGPAFSVMTIRSSLGVIPDDFLEADHFSYKGKRGSFVDTYGFLKCCKVARVPFHEELRSLVIEVEEEFVTSLLT